VELKGSLRNFPLPDIIQLIGMGRRSGVLNVTMNDGVHSAIFFDGGEMVHAEYGVLEGAPVIYKLFRKQDGNFQFSSGVTTSKRTIVQDWMSIVMEAARRFDEEERDNGPSSGPPEEGTARKNPAETRRRMNEIIERHFAKKAKKIQDELEKVETDPEKLLEFCNKVEKYIFVFIDNKKAKDVAEELRVLIRNEHFA
jgi:hypothetical protein